MSNIKKKLAMINRRTFLTGSFNTLIGLPVLDFMLNSHGNAFAAENAPLPKRFLMFTNGNALMNDKVNPIKVGKNFDLPFALKILNQYPSLKSKFSVLSNLGIPYDMGKKVNYGPRVRNGRNYFHTDSMVVQLTGKKAKGGHLGSGPSFDHILKNYFKTQTTHDHFNASVCLSHYGKNSNLDSRSAHQFDENGERSMPEENLMEYFNKLTQKVDVDSNNGISQARLNQLNNKKSVLDFINKRKLNYINNLVSTESRRKISNHLEKFRVLEKSLQNDLNRKVSSSCQKLSPIDKNHDSTKPDNTSDYTGEYDRSLIFVDLLAMAIQCDFVRFGNLVVTPTQSMINHRKLIEIYGKDIPTTYKNKKVVIDTRDYHQNTHKTLLAKDLNNPHWLHLSCGYRWHLDLMLRLASKLNNMSEGAGSALDNSIVYLASEGGWGPMSFSTGKGEFNGPHSTDNMTQFYLTGMKGLVKGEHIRPTQPRHACEGILTAMRAIGYKGNFGDLKNTINEMVS